jgi:hypothetical protein
MSGTGGARLRNTIFDFVAFTTGKNTQKTNAGQLISQDIVISIKGKQSFCLRRKERN